MQLLDELTPSRPETQAETNWAAISQLITRLDGSRLLGDRSRFYSLNGHSVEAIRQQGTTVEVRQSPDSRHYRLYRDGLLVSALVRHNSVAENGNRVETREMRNENGELTARLNIVRAANHCVINFENHRSNPPARQTLTVLPNGTVRTFEADTPRGRIRYSNEGNLPTVHVNGERISDPASFLVSIRRSVEMLSRTVGRSLSLSEETPRPAATDASSQGRGIPDRSPDMPSTSPGNDGVVAVDQQNPLDRTTGPHSLGSERGGDTRFQVQELLTRSGWPPLPFSPVPGESDVQRTDYRVFQYYSASTPSGRARVLETLRQEASSSENPHILQQYNQLVLRDCFVRLHTAGTGLSRCREGTPEHQTLSAERDQALRELNRLSQSGCTPARQLLTRIVTLAAARQLELLNPDGQAPENFRRIQTSLTELSRTDAHGPAARLLAALGDAATLQRQLENVETRQQAITTIRAALADVIGQERSNNPRITDSLLASIPSLTHFSELQRQSRTERQQDQRQFQAALSDFLRRQGEGQPSDRRRESLAILEQLLSRPQGSLLESGLGGIAALGDLLPRLRAINAAMTILESNNATNIAQALRTIMQLRDAGNPHANLFLTPVPNPAEALNRLNSSQANEQQAIVAQLQNALRPAQAAMDTLRTQVIVGRIGRVPAISVVSQAIEHLRQESESNNRSATDALPRVQVLEHSARLTQASNLTEAQAALDGLRGAARVGNRFAIYTLCSVVLGGQGAGPLEAWWGQGHGVVNNERINAPSLHNRSTQEITELRVAAANILQTAIRDNHVRPGTLEFDATRAALQLVSDRRVSVHESPTELQERAAEILRHPDPSRSNNLMQIWDRYMTGRLRPELSTNPTTANPHERASHFAFLALTTDPTAINSLRDLVYQSTRNNIESPCEWYLPTRFCLAVNQYQQSEANNDPVGRRQALTELARLRTTTLFQWSVRDQVDRFLQEQIRGDGPGRLEVMQAIVATRRVAIRESNTALASLLNANDPQELVRTLSEFQQCLESGQPNPDQRSRQQMSDFALSYAAARRLDLLVRSVARNATSVPDADRNNTRYALEQILRLVPERSTGQANYNTEAYEGFNRRGRGHQAFRQDVQEATRLLNSTRNTDRLQGMAMARWLTERPPLTVAIEQGRRLAADPERSTAFVAQGGLRPGLSPQEFERAMRDALTRSQELNESFQEREAIIVARPQAAERANWPERRERALRSLEQLAMRRFGDCGDNSRLLELPNLQAVDSCLRLREATTAPAAVQALRRLDEQARSGNAESGRALNLIARAMGGSDLNEVVRSLEHSAQSEQTLRRLQRVSGTVITDGFNSARTRHLTRDLESLTSLNLPTLARADGRLRQDVAQNNGTARDALGWLEAMIRMARLSAGGQGPGTPADRRQAIDQLGTMSRQGNQYARAALIRLLIDQSQPTGVAQWVNQRGDTCNDRSILNPDMSNIPPDERVQLRRQVAEYLAQSTVPPTDLEAQAISLAYGQSCHNRDRALSDSIRNVLSRALRSENPHTALRGMVRSLQTVPAGRNDIGRLMLTAIDHPSFQQVFEQADSWIRTDQHPLRTVGIDVLSGIISGALQSDSRVQLARDTLSLASRSEEGRNTVLQSLLERFRETGDHHSLLSTVGQLAGQQDRVSIPSELRRQVIEALTEGYRNNAHLANLTEDSPALRRRFESALSGLTSVVHMWDERVGQTLFNGLSAGVLEKLRVVADRIPAAAATAMMASATERIAADSGATAQNRLRYVQLLGVLARQADTTQARTLIDLDRRLSRDPSQSELRQEVGRALLMIMARATEGARAAVFEHVRQSPPWLGNRRLSGEQVALIRDYIGGGANRSLRELNDAFDLVYDLNIRPPLALVLLRAGISETEARRMATDMVRRVSETQRISSEAAETHIRDVLSAATAYNSATPAVQELMRSGQPIQAANLVDETNERVRGSVFAPEPADTHSRLVDGEHIASRDRRTSINTNEVIQNLVRAGRLPNQQNFLGRGLGVLQQSMAFVELTERQWNMQYRALARQRQELLTRIAGTTQQVSWEQLSSSARERIEPPGARFLCLPRPDEYELRRDQRSLLQDLRQLELNMAALEVSRRSLSRDGYVLEQALTVSNFHNLRSSGRTREADELAITAWGRWPRMTASYGWGAGRREIPLDQTNVLPINEVWTRLRRQELTGLTNRPNPNIPEQAFSLLAQVRFAPARREGSTAEPAPQDERTRRLVAEATVRRAFDAIHRHPSMEKVISIINHLSTLGHFSNLAQMAATGRRTRDLTQRLQEEARQVRRALDQLSPEDLRQVNQYLSELRRMCGYTTRSRPTTERPPIEDPEVRGRVIDWCQSIQEMLSEIPRFRTMCTAVENGHCNTATAWQQGLNTITRMGICAAAAAAVIASCGSATPFVLPLAFVAAGVGSDELLRGAGMDPTNRGSTLGAWLRNYGTFDQRTGRFRPIRPGEVAHEYGRELALNIGLQTGLSISGRAFNHIAGRWVAQDLRLTGPTAQAQVEQLLRTVPTTPITRSAVRTFFHEVPNQFRTAGMLDGINRILHAGPMHDVSPQLNQLGATELVGGFIYEFLKALATRGRAPRSIQFHGNPATFYAHLRRMRTANGDPLLRTEGSRNYLQYGQWRIPIEPVPVTRTVQPGSESVPLPNNLQQAVRPDATTSRIVIVDAEGGGMTAAAQRASRHYAIHHEMTGTVHDGTIIAGAGRSVSRDGSVLAGTSVLSVNRSSDTVLRDTIRDARQMLQSLPANQNPVEALARFVADRCSPNQGASTPEGQRLRDALYLQTIFRNSDRPMLLGEFIQNRVGGCREQAALFQVLITDLAHQLPPGTQSRMLRGNGQGTADAINHAWNVVTVNGRTVIVDCARGVFGRTQAESGHTYRPGSEMPREVRFGGVRNAGELRLGGQVELLGSNGWRVESITADNRQLTLVHDAATIVPHDQIRQCVQGVPCAGQQVSLRLADGTFQQGWTVRGIDGNGGLLLYRSNGVRITVNREHLSRAIPEMSTTQTAHPQQLLIERAISSPPTERQGATNQLREALVRQHGQEFGSIFDTVVAPEIARQGSTIQNMRTALQLAEALWARTRDSGMSLAQAQAAAEALASPQLPATRRQTLEDTIRAAGRPNWDTIIPSLPEAFSRLSPAERRPLYGLTEQQLNTLSEPRTRDLLLEATPQMRRSLLEALPDLIASDSGSGLLTRIQQYREFLTAVDRFAARDARSGELAQRIRELPPSLLAEAGLDAMLSAGRTTFRDVSLRVRYGELLKGLRDLPTELRAQVRDLLGGPDQLSRNNTKLHILENLLRVTADQPAALRSRMEGALMVLSDMSAERAAGPRIPRLEEIFSPRELEQIRTQEALRSGLREVSLSEPERSSLARRMYDTFCHNAPGGAPAQGRVLDIVIGPPGAGKSRHVNGPVQQANRSMLIDQDLVRPHINGYSPVIEGQTHVGLGADSVRAASSNVTNDVLRRSMENGNNIIYNCIGGNPEGLLRLISEARTMGYQINLHLADVPPTVAARNVFDRAQRPPENGIRQIVPPQFALDTGHNPLIVFNRIVNQTPWLLHSWRHIDLTGDTPRVVRSSESR